MDRRRSLLGIGYNNNVIYYTTSDNLIISLPSSADFGANVVSNTYNNGIGMIVCDGNVSKFSTNLFSRKRQLTSITIPDSVTSIGMAAFHSCSSLESITIPDGVTEINAEAFMQCTNLFSATIGSNVTKMGMAVFADCTRLSAVYCTPTTPPLGEPIMFMGVNDLLKIYVPRESVNTYKNAAGWKNYTSYIVGYDF